MKRLNWAVFTASLAVATWLPLNAQESDSLSLKELLIQKGIITEAEASGLIPSEKGGETGLAALLVRKGVISQAEADRLAVPGPGPAPVKPVVPAREDRFVAKAKEKAVESITFSGRLHGQLDALSTSYDQAADPDDEVNLFLRRIYLGAEASFADNLKATINANFANDAEGTAEIEKALITWSLSEFHTVSAGFTKVPMGYEETTSSSKIAAVERSVGTRYFTEQLDLGARHTGLFLNGEYPGGFTFTLAATNPEANSVSASSSTDKIALWGQVAWEGELAGGTLEAGLGAARIPETLNPGRTDTVYDLYANWKKGDFNLLLEYLQGDIDGEGRTGGDANPVAFTFLPSYRLNKNWELVARYSHVDADGGIGADISTVFRRAPENGSALFDDVTAYYLGGNWYIRGNTFKLSAGYEWARFEDNLTGSQGNADVDGFRTRLQLLF